MTGASVIIALSQVSHSSVQSVLPELSCKTTCCMLLCESRSSHLVLHAAVQSIALSLMSHILNPDHLFEA